MFVLKTPGISDKQHNDNRHFLMVFLIQNTQNRDAKAIHLKLDELLKGVKGARTSLVDLEDLTDEELDDLQTYYEGLHKEAASHATKRKGSKKKKKRAK